MKLKMLLAAALAGLFSLNSPLALAGDFDDFFAANAEFTLAQMSAKLPRKSDPAGAALLARLTNSEHLRSVTITSDEQRVALTKVCTATGTSAQAYMMDKLAAAGTDQDAAVKHVLGNMREYQDELALLLPYLVQCTGRTIPLAEAAAAQFAPGAMPSDRMLGLYQMRVGANQMLVGYVQEMSRDVFSEANRHHMSLAMIEAAPELIGILPLAERARIRDMILAAPKPQSPQLADDLAKMAELLADQRCEKLCKF